MAIRRKKTVKRTGAHPSAPNPGENLDDLKHEIKHHARRVMEDAIKQVVELDKMTGGKLNLPRLTINKETIAALQTDRLLPQQQREPCFTDRGGAWSWCAHC